MNKHYISESEWYSDTVNFGSLSFGDGRSEMRDTWVQQKGNVGFMEFDQGSSQYVPMVWATEFHSEWSLPGFEPISLELFDNALYRWPLGAGHPTTFYKTCFYNINHLIFEAHISIKVSAWFITAYKHFRWVYYGTQIIK